MRHASRGGGRYRAGQAEAKQWSSVAVVIPMRDRPRFIGRAVASVLANSYPAFQLLVVSADWLELIVAGFAAHPEAEMLYGTVKPSSRAPAPGGFVPVYQPDAACVADGRTGALVLGM